MCIVYCIGYYKNPVIVFQAIPRVSADMFVA